MKIAYYITGLGLGGAEVSTINLANKMAERGHQVMMIYLTGDNEHDQTIFNDIQVVGLQMPKNPLGLLRALWKARKIMKAFRPDVVHGQMIHANLFIRLLRCVVRLPRVISSEHSIDIQGKGRMWAYRLTDWLSDMNTNVSREATNRFIEQKAFSSHKSRPMYNGIDTARYQTDSEARNIIRQKYHIIPDEFVFLSAGRLTPAKDHRNLLQAFSQLGVHAKLIVLGKGELQQEIEQTIKEFHLNTCVLMVGAHPNVNDYYSAADCLVISSAWEGMPMVVIEAMANGLPIVSTHVGGTDETIQDPRWIVPAHNASALAACMRQMFELSRDERKAIGAHNRQTAQRFDINYICDEWELCYRLTR